MGRKKFPECTKQKVKQGLPISAQSVLYRNSQWEWSLEFGLYMGRGCVCAPVCLSIFVPMADHQALCGWGFICTQLELGQRWPLIAENSLFCLSLGWEYRQYYLNNIWGLFPFGFGDLGFSKFPKEMSSWARRGSYDAIRVDLFIRCLLFPADICVYIL